MIGVVEVESDEFESMIQQDLPSGSSHTHESKGTYSKFTLQIHTSNISHGHHMKLWIHVRYRP